jgi:crossover junction endodeoxyribonuclease RuvC
MIILGIDPGYAIVGYGVIDYNACRFSVLDSGAITTRSDAPFNERLEIIYDGIADIISRFPPEAMAVEKLFYHTNAKTVIDVSQARGAIILAAQKNGVRVFEYTPLQVKQSVVGYGRADKKQVQEMTRVILGLNEVPKPDDTADALAMAICHAHSSGSLMNGGCGKLKVRNGI